MHVQRSGLLHSQDAAALIASAEVSTIRVFVNVNILSLERQHSLTGLLQRQRWQSTLPSP